MKTTFLALVAFFCLSIAAFAASADGKWTADVPGRGGNTMQTTFTFKTEGNTLTGTVATERGENPIQNGKVDGDNISFEQVLNFNGNERRLNYKGTVSANEMKLTLSIANMDQTFDIVAKKIS